MILTCPQCQTRYRTEAANFSAAGRKVRCAKCGHIWHQTAAEPEPALPSAGATQDAPETAPTLSTMRAKLRGQSAQAADNGKPFRRLMERVGLALGWAGLAAMILLIGWTGFRFRQEIALLWPQSSSLFATFGVAVNPNGIELNDVNYRRDAQDGQSVLSVTGTLVNNSARELPIPPMRISLTDNDQRELYHWSYRPPQPTLRPGEHLKFVTRLAGAPSTSNLQLHFASQE